VVLPLQLADGLTKPGRDGPLDFVLRAQAVLRVDCEPFPIKWNMSAGYLLIPAIVWNEAR
jgi:hypothetical protein